MKIHYIGRETYQNGKPLMELLGKLKGYGVGRIVYRQHYKEQYPEPSFYIITRVEPYMKNISGKMEDTSLPGTLVYGERVFRGEAQGERNLSAHWKPDWRMVPRTEEQPYRQVQTQPLPKTYVKRYVDMPPLLKYVFERKLPLGKEMPVIRRKIKISYNNHARYEEQSS